MHLCSDLRPSCSVYSLPLCLYYCPPLLHLHSFPTRRSSDLPIMGHFGEDDGNPSPADMKKLDAELTRLAKPHEFYSYPNAADRKSTRLNSSHLVSSYAVFCLKKKKQQH